MNSSPPTADTQLDIPTVYLPRRRKKLDWKEILLIGIIGFTSVSLFFTIVLVFLFNREATPILEPERTPPSTPVIIPSPVLNLVTVVDDGNVREIQTNADTVGGLFEEQGIVIHSEDSVSESLNQTILTDMRIEIERGREIQLVVNGNVSSIRTTSANPQEILTFAEIEVEESDQLSVNGEDVTLDKLEEWSEPVTEIQVQRAVEVAYIDDGERKQFLTTEGTVGEALFAENVTLYLADIVLPNSDTLISDDLEIVIHRAKPITLQVDGTTIDTRVQADTVAEALEELGAALFDLDYVVPDENSPIEPDAEIRIVRVVEDLQFIRDTIPYEVVYQDHPEQELDEYITVQTGQEGVIETRIRVRYEDGKQVSRNTEETVTITPVQNEVIQYGTKIVIRTIDTPEGPREYWRKLTNMLTTSYKPEALGGDRTTSIGETLRKGIIAADPKIIPYRTNLYVPDYGLGIMADTGGPRSTRYWLDLGYEDHDWVPWRSYVTVYLLTPVPDNINYLLPGFVPD